jgi:hypothetical protein
MAVLVEALSVVVPRKVLDCSYPGGTEGYLAAAAAPPFASRFVCADDRLTSVSFWDPEAAAVLIGHLGEHGLVFVDEDACVELACVDQRFGPTMPCDWLEWECHADGFTMCWAAGTTPGELAAPEGWTPEQSRRLVRTDVRDDPDRMMKVGERDGLETWIDLGTGAESVGLPQRRPGEEGGGSDASETAPLPDGLLGVVEQVLREEGSSYTRVKANAVQFVAEGMHRKGRCTITVLEPQQQVLCYMEFGPPVPPPFRPAVWETLLRINDGLVFGNFDFRFRTGRVRFKSSTALSGEPLLPSMVRSMVSVGFSAMDYYGEAIMDVASGVVGPEEAIRRAEAS